MPPSTATYVTPPAVSHRAHRIEGDAARAHHRATGLEHQLRRRVEPLGDGRDGGGGGGAQVRGVVVVRVRDRETAPEVEHGPALRSREPGEPRHRLEVRVEIADLRAEVHVQAVEPQVREGCGAVGSARDVAGGDPELRRHVRRADLGVRRGLDARRDAEQDRLDSPRLRCDPLDLVELLDMVDDEQAGLGLHRSPDVRVRLVVAMNDEPPSGRARGERVGKLALRCDVHPQPLVEQDPQEADGRVRLAGVHRPGRAGIPGQRLLIGPRPGSERGLVVDVKRRAVGQRELRERDAADTEPPRLDGGRSGSTDIRERLVAQGRTTGVRPRIGRVTPAMRSHDACGAASAGGGAARRSSRRE